MSLFADPDAEAVPIHCVTREAWAAAGEGPDGLRDRPGDALRGMARALGFEAKPDQHAVLPGPDGRIAAVLFGIEPTSSRLSDPLQPGRLATLLPAATYRFAGPALDRPDLAALSWLLSSYRFTRYRSAAPGAARLVAPA